MAVSDGDTLTVFRNMGLVSNVFDDRTLAPLVGHLAIGHTRYSTTGSSTWGNAQPVYRNVGEHQLALGHNGNLTNTAKLAAEHGMLPGTVASDSDLVAELLADEMARAGTASSSQALEDALVAVLPRLEGAFSFVVMDTERIYGMRDPNGLRPLCLGRKGDAWVLASESPALDIVGARMVREVEAGEVVVLDAAASPGRCGPSRPSASSPGSASSSSSTSPAPTPGSTARACTTPGSARARPSPSRPRSRPTW